MMAKLMRMLTRTMFVLAVSLLLLPMAAALSITIACPERVNAGANFDCTLDYTLSPGETLAGIDFQFSGEGWVFGTPTTTAGLIAYNPAMKSGNIASATSFTAHPLLTIPVTAPPDAQIAGIPVKVGITAYDENSVSSTVSVPEPIVQVLGAAAAGLGDPCDAQTQCSGDLTCISGTCRQQKIETACTQNNHCASNNCDDNICCNLNQENVAGKCVGSSAITGAATDIANALRNNAQYPTLLQKIARIAALLRGLLALS